MYMNAVYIMMSHLRAAEEFFGGQAKNIMESNGALACHKILLYS